MIQKFGLNHQMQNGEANYRYLQNAADPQRQASTTSSLQSWVVQPNEQAAAIRDVAAAIRELADVLYHIHTED